MDTTTTRWWWVRHAPVVNHGGKIYGQGDVECDTSDGKSFAGLAAKLPEEAIWVRSHLVRTRQTADAIKVAGGTGPEPLVEKRFAEQSFGDWQQRSWDELHAAGSPEYRDFWSDPGCNAPPGGESFADLVTRTSAGIDQMNLTYSGRDIVAVTHGGTIRAALSIALDTSPIRALAVKIDNLTLTRLDYLPGGTFKGQGGHWRVVGVNLPPV